MKEFNKLLPDEKHVDYQWRTEDIISYEVMGSWPIHRMNIRDIIHDLGFTYDKNTDTWSIPNSSEVLDLYPRTLEDDGMGYGVNEQNIISVNIVDKKYCNMFVEHELPNLNVWKKAKYRPGIDVVEKETSKEYWITTNIKEDEESGDIYYECFSSDTNEKIWINENNLN